MNSTYIFENTLTTETEFIPMQTIESEEFGRHFFIDIAFNFLSAPSYTSGGYDKSQIGYVSEWTDWDGVDISKLLNIHKFCILNKTEYAGSLSHREVN